MKTISHPIVSEYEIKKSKFIALLFPISEIKKVEEYLNQAKKDYPKATHYCYAYKIGNQQKCSDDQEPSGTAGLPILEEILKKDFTNILCIVVRYFGGIKLGSSGLIRAYRKTVRDAIFQSNIIEIEKGYLIQLEIPYEWQKKLEYQFSGKIVKKEFQEKIMYQLEVSLEEMQKLPKDSYQILEEKMIEKRSQ